MRRLISNALWPALLGGAVAVLAIGFAVGQPMLFLNLSYFALALALLVLERVMPYERVWLDYDGQLLPDLGHTLLSKTAVQILIVSLAAMGLADAVGPEGAPWWPGNLPWAAQIVLGLIIAETGFYWAHRLAHEWPLLWRFHAVHHSVTRLWVVNTGRFHFIDTLFSVAVGLSLAFVAGVPGDILMWVSAITAYVGLLTHCNVEMRPGVLNYVFNTPQLHR